MFKLLFKYVIPTVLFLVTGLVFYNYFYGSAEEKEQSRQIISKVTGLGQEVFNLLVTEQGKFQDGKYDDALDKIGSAIDSMKQFAGTASDRGREWINYLNDLQSRKQQLESELQFLKQQELAASQPGTAQPRSFGGQQSPDANREAMIADLERRISELAQATESLASQMGGSN
ncbi:MAG: hypothetical protein AAF456_20350 [Planctomycetota bacterium]